MLLCHQDDSGGFLDWWAQQNCRMDSLAKKHLAKTRRRPRVQVHFRHQGWSISLNGTKMTSYDKKAIYNYVYNPKVKKYWQTKAKPHLQDTWDKCNWVATAAANRALPWGMRRCISKLTTGNCAVGKMMQARKEWTHSKCPRCGEDHEGVPHVLRCPGGQAQWEKSVDKLKKWMEENHTAPAITRVVIAQLNSWHKDEPCRISNIQTRQAVNQQNAMGWFQFLLGRHSKAFEKIQASHLSQNRIKRNPKRWAINMVHRCFDILWDMWDHRNKIMTNDPDTLFALARDDDLNTEIQEQYQLGRDTLYRRDRHLLDRLEDNLIAADRNTKIQWLSSITGARNAFNNRAVVTNDNSLQRLRNRLNRFLDRDPNKSNLAPGPLPKHTNRRAEVSSQERAQYQGSMEDWVGTQFGEPPAPTGTSTSVPEPPDPRRQTSMKSFLPRQQATSTLGSLGKDMGEPPPPPPF